MQRREKFMNFYPKRRLISYVLCAAMVCTPISAAAGSSSAAESENDSWGLLEAQLEEADHANADYDGYIVKIKPKALRSTVQMADAEDGIETISREDGLYAAADLEAVEDFVSAKDIEYIEPDYIVDLFDSDMRAIKTEVSEDANDEHLALMNADIVRDEYGISGDDMDSETDMGNDGKPEDQIIVAVIDSGLDPDHEDIDYTRVLSGESFVSTATTADTMGHGTFVTGEIIADAGNGTGIDGMADDLYVMPLKVFSSKTTSNSVVIKAINYATEQKRSFDETDGKEGSNICVINMSLGSEGSSAAMKSAVDSAIEAGIIVVCAAGNDEDDRASYPAQYAIGVGSTDSKGERSYYSQILAETNGQGWQNKVWVTGPGESYTSLWYTGEYYTGSGTSFSSPQAATLAALAVSLKNDLTSCYDGQKDSEGNEITNNHYAFRQLLKDTARPLDNGLSKASNGQDTYYGWGMIDFQNMVDTLTDYQSQVGNPAQVGFTVDNGAGTILTSQENNLEISVKAYGEDGQLSDVSETAGEDGVFTLKIGTKYQYTITADKYTEVKKDFTVVMPSRQIFVSMEGLDYYTGFSVRNSAGDLVPNASVTVKKESGGRVEQNSDGTFSTKNGNYTYVISAEGYFPKSGSFTINDAEQEYPEQKYDISVVLTGAQDICSVTFDISGSDGDPYPEVSVFDNDGGSIEPYSDGAWKLSPGTYRYSVESDYYKPISGEITVIEEEKGSVKVISAVMTERLYWAFIDVMPLPVLEAEGTSIIVTDDQGNAVEPFHGAIGEYRIVNGHYNYVVKAEGYKTAKGDFTISGEIVYVDVELEEGTDTEEGSGSGSGGSSGGNSGGSGGSSGGSGSGSGGSSGGSGGSSGGNSGSGNSGSSDGNNAGQNGNPADENNGSLGGKYETMEVEYHQLDDVISSNWFYEPVNFVMTAGLFQGISPNSFGPNQNMTRGMLVTVLYRLSGETVTDVRNPFSDVSDGAYYADAAAWAYQNKIVSGVSADRFEPEADITREQLTVMLRNYAAWDEKDTVVKGDGAAQTFSDYGAVSAYAETAVSWAFEKEIVNGDDQGNFRPKDHAARAEVASMMMNFLKKLF